MLCILVQPVRRTFCTKMQAIPIVEVFIKPVRRTVYINTSSIKKFGT